MTVRVGVVGTGWGQRAHIPGFNACPDTQVVAVCSRRLERARAAAEAFKVPFSTDSYAEFLDQDLDLVSVTTPPPLHAEMVEQAVARGCHVLCEKPMALDAAEARRMLAAAEEAGVLHLIDFELRFHPNRMKLAQLIHDGQLGEVRQVAILHLSSSRLDPEQPWDWWSDAAQGGGILRAVGSHQVDLLRWWLGEVLEVGCMLRTFQPTRLDPESAQPRPVSADEYAGLRLGMASGAEAAVLLSTVARPERGVRTEVHGSQGSAILDGDEKLLVRLAGEPLYRDHSQPEPLASLPRIEKSPWAISFVRLASQLVRAVRGEGPLTGATFADGLRSQEVLDAARLSHREGRRVELAELAQA